MRPFVTLLCSTIALALTSGMAEAQKKKLYRWTDAKGEVHYTDQLPPEAAQAARDELNAQGMPVESVRRAMTAEERAAFEKEKIRLDEEKRVAEEKAKMDGVLLASYPTEADLERAYKERFELIGQSVTSAEVGISSQEKSLTSMLGHAAGLEREGKIVPQTVVESINRTRVQVGEQRAFLVKRQAESKALHDEYDAVLARYRELNPGKTTSKP